MIVALCTGAQQVHAKEKEKTDEKLEYVIKIAGVEFGNITLVSDQNRYYGELFTNKKWGEVYAVNNRMASWVKEDSTPVKAEINYDMKGKKTRFNFDFGSREVSITRWAAHKNPKKYKRRGDAKVYDVLSMLMAVRKRPTDREQTFKVITGRKVYDVVFEPSPEEDLITPLGVKRAKPFMILVTRPGGFKQEMKVWFEKNEESVPIRLQGFVKFGTFSVDLMRKLEK